MSSNFKYFHAQRPQFVLVALGVIATVLVGYTVGRIGHGPAKASDRPKESATPASADGFKPGHRPVTKSARQEIPLPPAGTPLRSTFDTLRRLSAAETPKPLWYVGVRNGNVEVVWPVSARGKAH